MTNQIKIITAPDILFNDSIQILLVSPSKNLQKELQDKFLSTVDDDVNVYYYNEDEYDKENIKWLLSVFKMSDITIIDLDNCPSTIKELASYMIGKNKTYWLTNAQETVYNHISENRVYTLDFMSTIGGNFETESK
jgi:hypothetical protein